MLVWDIPNDEFSTRFRWDFNIPNVRISSRQRKQTMPKNITILDDREWPSAGFHFDLPIRPESTALGVIDVQGYAIDSVGQLAHTLAHCSPELHQGFQRRVESMVANIERLQALFRENERRVFFTRHGAQTRDGADLVARRRNREQMAHASTNDESGHMAVKGDVAYEIIAPLAPLPEELVLDKNTSSAFHTTAVDLYLRNMGVETIVLTGIAADMCVLATAIDAADRGFNVIIATDAVATLDTGIAEASQVLFGRVWGYVMTTETITRWLTTGQMPEPHERRLSV